MKFKVLAMLVAITCIIPSCRYYNIYTNGDEVSISDGLFEIDVIDTTGQLIRFSEEGTGFADGTLWIAINSEKTGIKDEFQIFIDGEPSEELDVSIDSESTATGYKFTFHDIEPGYHNIAFIVDGETSENSGSVTVSVDIPSQIIIKPTEETNG